MSIVPSRRVHLEWADGLPPDHSCGSRGLSRITKRAVDSCLRRNGREARGCHSEERSDEESKAVHDRCGFCLLRESHRIYVATESPK